MLTILFVMLAEILIFVPSVARFRMTELQERLELAQLASLSVLATPDDMVAPELADELLDNAGVINIVLRRNEVRELIISKPMPAPVDETFDLRDASPMQLITDALRCLFAPDDRVIRIIGQPIKGAGLEIETVLYERPVKEAMRDYGLNILWLSALISIITAALLFFSVRGLLVRPITKVVDNMMSYRDDPADARRIIEPSSQIRELHEAEQALQDLQVALSQSLRQKARLAALGGAVARVSHDLRNILTTSQLLADRLEVSSDPVVARTAPKLLGALQRAVTLCESTLTFGKAEEPAPTFQKVVLRDIADEVLENDALRKTGDLVDFDRKVSPAITLVTDRDHLFRILTNLVRNARQAIEASKVAGTVTIRAEQIGEEIHIRVEDSGPGLPPRARDHLFRAFEGGARQGGTGLGLAISWELAHALGGTLELEATSQDGTCFLLVLPRKR
ncbi:sensor histidine kinase [Oceanomicrobium pacificus]|uniref:sensor histidine kinase n=1 Tax=Oceanomicrobium pacificus TaxID=2692916 RepID=UPI002E2E173B|nr:HAMP domain-containing sensor histidine kinase [Oceanomicrobium pacificus]